MNVPVQSFDLLALFLIPLIESWCHVTTLGHVKTQFFQDDLHFSHQLRSYMDVQNIKKPRTVAIEREREREKTAYLKTSLYSGSWIFTGNENLNYSKLN